MQYNERLDAELKALEGDMIETLQRWIRVPSVRAERSADNAPFGENVRRALDTAMADLKRLGMEPRDVDGYCCDTEIGQGDEVIAVLSHLDVVPEGEGWAHDPYGAEIIDGEIWARGSLDTKCIIGAFFEATEYLIGRGYQRRQGPRRGRAVRDEGDYERGDSAAPPLPPDSGLRRGMRHAGSGILRPQDRPAGTRLLPGRELPAD